MLVACEAPLMLERVELEKRSPIHRYDEFLAATSGRDKVIVVVGNEGTVLSSADGARTWQRQQLVDKPALIDIAVCPDGLLVALDFGQRIWISKNNAASWSAADLPGSEAPQAITCDPWGRLWVVSSFSGIFSSRDGGKSWDASGLDEDIILTTVQFVDHDTGIISGEFGTLLISTDAGASWERRQPIPEDFYPQAAYFKDINQGWVVGLNGVIYHTPDGARSWIKQETGSIAPLFGIAAQGATLYAVGDGGLVLRLLEDHWRIEEPDHDISSYLRVVQAIDNQHLLLAGGRGGLAVVASEPGARL